MGSAAEKERMLLEITTERLTGKALTHYVTPAMLWGIEMQSEAIASYEAAFPIDLCGPEGFVIHPTIEFFGATPDGFIGADGLIEVKCPNTTTHIKYILDKDTVPKQYRPQLAAQLLCTGRRWVNFVSYDPRLLCKPLLVIRFEPPQEYLDKVQNAAVEFLGGVEGIIRKITDH